MKMKNEKWNSSQESAGRKLMEKILAKLAKRSERSLCLARKEIMRIKVENQNGRDALEYYAADWNDYTHPGILSVACEAVGGKHADSLPMEIIILLLTAGMDIHDDIIDETETKNGRLTVYGKFGKDVALLTGDAFLLRGFISLCELMQNHPTTMVKPILSAIQDTLTQVGNAHLIESKLRTEPKAKLDEYMQMAEEKGANIELLMKVGTIIGKGSPKEVRALGEFGRILGLLITLREEFIDTFEPEELRNKMRKRCLPVPILYALEDTQSAKEIFDIMTRQKISIEGAKKVVDLVFESKHVKALLHNMKTLSEEAVLVLSKTSVRQKAFLQLLVKAALEDLEPEPKCLA
jgi:geranylgeranyl pyrophosphate synthase